MRTRTALIILLALGTLCWACLAGCSFHRMDLGIDHGTLGKEPQDVPTTHPDVVTSGVIL